MLHIALVIVQFFSAAAIIGLVLLQRGKGAEAGAGFGAGASGTVFGARGAGTALSRATAILTAIFMLNSLVLVYMAEHTTSTPKSIFQTAGQLGSHSGAHSQSGLRSVPASGSSASAKSAGASGSAAPAARSAHTPPAAPNKH